MSRLNLAVATRFLGQPLKTAIRTAGEIGAQGVQLEVRNEFRATEFGDTARRQFKHHLQEQMLALATFEFPMRYALTDVTELDSRVGALKASLEFAYSMGVRTVVGRVGRIPEDAGSTEFDELCQILNDIARHSNRVGATFAMTPSTDSVETLTAVFDAVTEGPLGLNLDPAALLMSGRNAVATYRALYERVESVQLRDGLRDIDGQGLEVPVGRGEVPWDEMLALLEEGRFGGWIVATRSVGDDRVGDISRALRYIRNVAQG